MCSSQTCFLPEIVRIKIRQAVDEIVEEETRLIGERITWKKTTWSLHCGYNAWAAQLKGDGAPDLHSQTNK